MERNYLKRAIGLALLFILQTGFTVYGLILLISIEAKSYVWAIWIPYQVIGWLWFFWQFASIAESNSDAKRLFDEMKVEAKTEIKAELIADIQTQGKFRMTEKE